MGFSKCRKFLHLKLEIFIENLQKNTKIKLPRSVQVGQFQLSPISTETCIIAKLSPSPVQLELRLALSSIITTHHIASATNPPHSLRNQPTHPHPGK